MCNPGYLVDNCVLKACLTLCDPMDYTCQAPPSVGVPRQEYWSGLPFPFPGDFPNPGIKPAFLASIHGGQVLYHWATWDFPQSPKPQPPLSEFRMVCICIFTLYLALLSLNSSCSSYHLMAAPLDSSELCLQWALQGAPGKHCFPDSPLGLLSPLPYCQLALHSHPFQLGQITNPSFLPRVCNWQQLLVPGSG